MEPLRGMAAGGANSKTESLVQRVLSDPTLYPDEFKSWITRFLKNNVNFVVTASQLPSTEKDHLVGLSSGVPFQNSWENFGGANEAARYWKDSTGIVHIGGIVKSGVIGQSIFDLPQGYRPQYTMIYPAVSNNAFGVITIQPDGTVQATAGSNVYFALSGVTFRQFD